MLSSAFLDA